MNKLILVAAMLMTTMAVNLSIYQKSATLSTVSDGMKVMQNAFLDKNQTKNETAPIEGHLLQIASHDGPETESKALENEAKNLKDIFKTKVVVFGAIWSVADWTIFIIVVAIILVATLVFVIFCCCMSGDDKKPEEPKMEEKKEEEKMDDKMEDMMMEPEMMAAE